MNRFSALTVLFCLVTASHAETYTVCSSGCDYTSINAAIDAASDGDVIQLMVETYQEGSEINTLGKAITLRGALDKDGAPASILDGAGSHRVLLCTSGETSATQFENLEIRNGYVDEVEDDDDKEWNYRNGGGLRCSMSSPTLSNCVFLVNRAKYGGALSFMDGCDSTVIGCRFEGNSGINDAGVVYVQDSVVSFSDCVCTGNIAKYGGVLYGTGSTSWINCEFTENITFDYGGALYAYGDGLTVTDCRFVGNTSDNGGAIYATADEVTIVRCAFEGNQAIKGGALRYSNSEGVGIIDQCTFRNNVGAADGAIRIYGAPTVSDCTIFGNQGPLGAGMAVVSTSHAPSLSGTTICGNYPDQVDGDWQDIGSNCVQDACDACSLSVAVPVEPSVDVLVEDTFATEFVSKAGITYELESTPDLVSSNFSGTGAFVIGTGTNMVLFDPTGFSDTKHYRVAIK